MYDGSWKNADFIDYAASVGAQGVELLSVFW
ncbi:sugar phosphate isomerase/epimerase, partial [Pseudoxanthomonas sp. KAs_5_3]